MYLYVYSQIRVLFRGYTRGNRRRAGRGINPAELFSLCRDAVQKKERLEELQALVPRGQSFETASFLRDARVCGKSRAANPSRNACGRGVPNSFAFSPICPGPTSSEKRRWIGPALLPGRQASVPRCLTRLAHP